MPEKIVRSLCLFAESIDALNIGKLASVREKLLAKGFVIQTERCCIPLKDFALLEAALPNKNLLISIGSCNLKFVIDNFYDFCKAKRTSCHIDITEYLTEAHVDLLFRLMHEAPEKLFQFAFVVNNAPSSPYFPSANFEKNGFAIGLQPTNLAAGCKLLKDWFQNMQQVWIELADIFNDEQGFLGIDSSIAPLFEGNGSLLHFLTRILGNFDKIVLSDDFMEITAFIKKANPKPIGLCGLMLPCLEDFVLANAYENGKFNIERNLFLSMHSGLGIDTYPIGVNEAPEKVLRILQLLRQLSNRYKKPLSARFISDGKAKIGEMTDFQNQYLKDVIVRNL
ncbi:MAG: DUF711 family protein [Bacteroidota bacterium]